MSDDRLPTALWVDGHLKTLQIRAVPYYIWNTGERNSGVVLVKINALNGWCVLLIQQRNLEGVMGWMHALGKEEVEEREADEYIRRAIARDPDLWAIEIEDRDKQNPFDGDIF